MNTTNIFRRFKNNNKDIVISNTDIDNYKELQWQDNLEYAQQIYNVLESAALLRIKRLNILKGINDNNNNLKLSNPEKTTLQRIANKLSGVMSGNCSYNDKNNDIYKYFIMYEKMRDRHNNINDINNEDKPQQFNAKNSNDNDDDTTQYIDDVLSSTKNTADMGISDSVHDNTLVIPDNDNDEFNLDDKLRNTNDKEDNRKRDHIGTVDSDIPF